jgi:hypothetical protein
VKTHACLEVVVGVDCVASETARGHALVLQRSGPPGLEVRIVDLGVAGTVVPTAVFAVPTYLLDGEVISLGNPEYTWLVQRIERSLAGEGATPCREPSSSES